MALQLVLAQQTLPATTPDAEAIARPWRDFQHHLRQAHRYPDAYRVLPLMNTSDQMLLDMLAVGNEDLPAEWYHMAAEQHYRPRWLGPQWAGYSFADVWTRFIATLTLHSEGGGGA